MEPRKDAPAQWKHLVKEGRTPVKERKPQSKEKAPSKKEKDQKKNKIILKS